MKKAIFTAATVLVIIQFACTPKVAELTIREQIAAIDTTIALDTNLVIEEIDYWLTDDKQPEILLLFRKTPCYGNCEAYLVEVYDDGKAYLDGQRAIENIGNYTATVDSMFFTRLYLAADKIDYYNLSRQYPTSGPVMKAFPPTLTYIKNDSLSNGIYNAHHSPVTLQKFEKFIAKELENLDWKKEE